ncbi:MAG: DUF1800 domain-containing protein [bacterium]
MSLTALPPDRFDRAAAAHLLARAGFGGPPRDIDRLHALGLHGAVDSLLDFSGESIVPPDWVVPGVEIRHRAERLLEHPEPMTEDEIAQYTTRQRNRDLARTTHTADWWFDRMYLTSTPLREKLTLFWHGHFATQTSKVQNGPAMWGQNQMFREYGAGPFAELLRQLCRDPAMLRYLDNDENRRGNPNENFGRELLELFTLGEGNYTEEDVREAARAFTGWGIESDRMVFARHANQHDDGPKTVLGASGPLDGDDVVRILTSRPRCWRFLGGKLQGFFVRDDRDPDLTEAIAVHLELHDGHIGETLRDLFTSSEFYSDSVRLARVKGPVEWLVGFLRSMELGTPPSPWRRDLLEHLGQSMFEPPNVAGWPGGRRWITAAALLTRFRALADLLLTPGLSPVIRDDVRDTLIRGTRRETADALIDRLFLPPPAEEVRAELARLLDPLPPPDAWTNADLREAISRFVGTFHYQLV